MQEFVIKKSNRVELMAMLGLFGALISAIQMYPLKVALAHFFLPYPTPSSCPREIFLLLLLCCCFLDMMATVVYLSEKSFTPLHGLVVL
jgi:hypothetical protein